MDDLDSQLRSVAVASTPQDFADALNLRYAHICHWNQYQEDKGNAVASIGDKYDAYTDYIIHRSVSGQVDGILRLIRANEHGYFMEQYLRLADHLQIDGQTIELCELVTHKDSRANLAIIGLILIRLGRYLIDRNASSMAAISIDAMHPIMLTLGFRKIGDGFMTGWNKRMTLFVSNDRPTVLRNICMIAPSELRAAIAEYYEIAL